MLPFHLFHRIEQRFTGASEGIRAVMKLMTNPEGASSRRPGVMIPIPQYPLYSASLAEYNMEQVSWHFLWN